MKDITGLSGPGRQETRSLACFCPKEHVWSLATPWSNKKCQWGTADSGCVLIPGDNFQRLVFHSQDTASEWSLQELGPAPTLPLRLHLGQVASPPQVYSRGHASCWQPPESVWCCPRRLIIWDLCPEMPSHMFNVIHGGHQIPKSQDVTHSISCLRLTAKAAACLPTFKVNRKC